MPRKSFLFRGFFLTIGHFLNRGIIIPGIKIFQNWGILISGIEDFSNLGIFIPGIGDFYPGDGGFFKIWGWGIFYPRDFLRIGIFRGWGFFFRGMTYPTKNPTLI